MSYPEPIQFESQENLYKQAKFFYDEYEKEKKRNAEMVIQNKNDRCLLVNELADLKKKFIEQHNTLKVESERERQELETKIAAVEHACNCFKTDLRQTEQDARERIAELEDAKRVAEQERREWDNQQRVILKLKEYIMREHNCYMASINNPSQCLSCNHQTCPLAVVYKPSGDEKGSDLQSAVPNEGGVEHPSPALETSKEPSDDGKLGANSTQGEPAAVASSESSVSSEVQTSLNTHLKSSEGKYGTVYGLTPMNHKVEKMYVCRSAKLCPNIECHHYTEHPQNELCKEVCGQCGSSVKCIKVKYCTCESSPPGVLLRDGTCGGCGGIVNQPESLHNVCRHCGSVIMPVVKKTYNNACKCVIVYTNSAEDSRLSSLEKKGKEFALPFIKDLFEDGRDWIPDADCKFCNGTGFVEK
jgi:hypothetical protein